MNMPRTKPSIRFGSPPKKKVRIPPLVQGAYQNGIHNEEIASLVGAIITALPHVEECMITVMALLLGDSQAPARQVFRSLNSEDARVKVMRSLLETAKHNASRGPEFDEIIDLFVEVKKRRNAYAHGLWWTHQSGRTFIEEPSPDSTVTFISRREVKSGELVAVLKRIFEFRQKWSKHIYMPFYCVTKPQSLKEILRKQPPQESK